MLYKKGQQAMELIATYGWVALLLFVIVAFLHTSGFFDHSRFELDDCTLQPNLPCERYYVQTFSGSSARVAFDVRNKMGFPILIDDYTSQFEGQTTRCTDEPPSVCRHYLANGDGARLIVDFDTPYQLTEDDYARIFLDVNFIPCNGLNETECLAEAGSRSPISTSGRVFTYPRGTPGIYLSPPPDDEDPDPDPEDPPPDDDGPDEDIEDRYCTDDTHYSVCVNDVCAVDECFAGQYCCPSTTACEECLPGQTRCSPDGTGIDTCSQDCGFGKTPCLDGQVCREVLGAPTCVIDCLEENLCQDELDLDRTVCCEEPKTCMPKGDIKVCTDNEEEIDSCMDLTEAGRTYKLDSDLILDADSFDGCCIIVKADDITIDGQGHSISLNEDPKQHVAICSDKENTQIKDVSISRFNTGIILDSSTNSHVSGVRTDEITEIGLRAFNVQILDIYDNILNSDKDGVNLRGAIDVTINKNTMNSGRNAGIRVSGGSRNVLITKNKAHAKENWAITVNGENIEVRDNTATISEAGFGLTGHGRDIRIINNRIITGGSFAMTCSCDDSLIESNTVLFEKKEHAGAGYCLSTKGKNNVIQNNDFSGADDCGVSIKESENILFRSNTLGNPQEPANAISIRKSAGIKVLKNDVITTSHSIRVAQSSDLEIADNNLESRIMGNVDFNEVYDSDVFNNQMIGMIKPMSFEDSDGNNVYDNIIKSNRGAEVAVWFLRSSDNKLYSNEISATRTSTLIHMATDSTNNHIYDNILYNADVYIKADNDENQFYTIVNGVEHGNYYANIADIEIIDSDGDGYGDSGDEYPYWQDVSQGKWLGLGEDLGPKMRWD